MWRESRQSRKFRFLVNPQMMQLRPESKGFETRPAASIAAAMVAAVWMTSSDARRAWLIFWIDG